MLFEEEKERKGKKRKEGKKESGIILNEVSYRLIYT